MITKEQARAHLDHCGEDGRSITYCRYARTVIALHERVDRLTEAAIAAAQELRVIAGMDLIAASAVAFNAARSLEAILKETTHD